MVLLSVEKCGQVAEAVDDKIAECRKKCDEKLAAGALPVANYNRLVEWIDHVHNNRFKFYGICSGARLDFGQGANNLAEITHSLVKHPAKGAGVGLPGVDANTGPEEGLRRETRRLQLQSLERVMRQDRASMCSVNHGMLAKVVGSQMTEPFCRKLIAQLEKSEHYTMERLSPMPNPLVAGSIVRVRVASTKEAPEGQPTSFYVDKIVTLRCEGSGQWVCWCSGLQCHRWAMSCRHLLFVKGGANGLSDGGRRYLKAVVNGELDHETFRLAVSELINPFHGNTRRQH